MERRIVGFLLDAEGEWVAELECGHRQHVRHRPPFQVRPWVLDDAERAGRLGTPLDCPLCDRAEMPERVTFAWRSALWDDGSIPKGLRRAHRLGSRTWGRVVVQEGSLTYRAKTVPPIDRVLGPGSTEAVPPGVDHEIEPAEGARFFVELFNVLPPESADPPGRESS